MLIFMSRVFLYCLLVAIMAVPALLPASFAAQVVGTASINAPAVILQNNTGSLTGFTLVVTRGDGNVAILGPSSVANSTLASAQTAAAYASAFLGLNYSSYNFTYTISDMNQSVSGPSAGTAMTLLAISALSGRPLRHDFTVTGTISGNGSVGEIGGVYDKASAASYGGMRFILVPAVPASSQENELYYLVQTTFGLPLVQVANISDAVKYAFGNTSVSGAGSYYSLYTNYSAGRLPQASLSCSNGCDPAQFTGLVNFTLNFTRSEIGTISQPSFRNVTRQLYMVANESSAIASRGYLYAAADIGFLNYINAYFFASHNATRQGAQLTLDNVSSYCGSVNAPQLTSQNYEWVFAGELRQAWGSYTISTTLSGYDVNTSALDTDEVLGALYSAAQAEGWCRASSFMYGVASGMGGTPVILSQGLGAVASSRLTRAAPFGPSLYFTTAQSAYASKNYPLAIIDADYAFALSSAGSAANLSTGRLDALALSMAANSTYGIWPTQFANEAEFYVNESMLASNSTTAHTYAFQAYSSALLAQQMSNDTRVISQNLVSGTPTTTVMPSPTNSTLPLNTSGIAAVLLMVWIAIVIVLIVDAVIVALLITLLSRVPKRRRRRKG